MSSASDDESPVIVIDAGSGSCKAGFAGEDAPFSYFSSVVGIPKYAMVNDGIAKGKNPDSFVGGEAQAKRDLLALSYPIERGVVTDWDNAERLFDFAFRDLKVEPTGTSVLMAEPPLNPMANREKMTQLMFESFNVDEFFMNSSSTLSMFAFGRSVGMIVDIGEGITTVSANCEVISVHDAVQRQDLAGLDITHALQKRLYERELCFSNNSELEFVRELKEKMCFVSLGEGSSKNAIICVEYFTLPDGKTIQLFDEHFMCTEALFNPLAYAGQNLRGLHELVNDCFKNLDVDIRNNFYSNILLAGGTSIMPGLPKRLEYEMRNLVPAGKLVKVVAFPEREYSCWVGGSILGSLSLYGEGPMNKKDYEEFGPSLAHRKFM